MCDSFDVIIVLMHMHKKYLNSHTYDLFLPFCTVFYLAQITYVTLSSLSVIFVEVSVEL